jgi:GxxExxY protein
LLLFIGYRLSCIGGTEPFKNRLSRSFTAEDTEVAEEIDVDVDEKPNAVTGKIIAAALKVHRALGPGLLQSAYEACTAFELVQDGLRVEQQKPLPLIYREVQLDCGYRLDLLVEGEVIVEIKAVDSLAPNP